MRVQNQGVVWVWTWEGKTVSLGVERRGHGPTLLTLPALGASS